MLAGCYLTVNQYRDDKLLTFDSLHKKDESSFLFLLAFGGDGAPGVGTFMLFGADVEESSLLARCFVKKAILFRGK